MATAQCTSASPIPVQPLGFLQSGDGYRRHLKRSADDDLADWNSSAKRRLETQIGGVHPMNGFVGRPAVVGPFVDGQPQQSQAHFVSALGAEDEMDVGQVHDQGTTIGLMERGRTQHAFDSSMTAMETNQVIANIPPTVHTASISSNKMACQRCLAGEGGHFKHIIHARHFQDDSLW